MEPDSLFAWNVLNLCSGKSKLINLGDFEPLPISFLNDDEPCDELASFLEDFDFTLQSSIPTYAPLSFSRKVSDESPHLHNQEMPRQNHNTMSMIRQSSFQESCQMEPDSLFVWNVLNLCSGQSKRINLGDFEPLPISFLNDDEPCDELASFLEDLFNDFDG